MKNNESKYKQVVNFVIDGIAEGKLQKGDWIPSINEFRENYRLSRDTVFAGLSELKSRGIIASTPGVGYYIASARIPSEQNIFLLFNEFNEFKEDLYNSFMEHVGKGVSVDLYFHNYNRRVFDALVTDANGKYTTYIIMPGKFTGIGPLLESLSGRVFLLDHFHPELLGRYSSVAQNFEKDTYEALCHGLRHIRKYERLLMVQHEKKEPQERYDGLVRFCAEHGFGHEYLASIRDREIREGDLFILVSDRDLVTLLKQAERQQMTPGREFGIISYNDTPPQGDPRGRDHHPLDRLPPNGADAGAADLPERHPQHREPLDAQHPALPVKRQRAAIPGTLRAKRRTDGLTRLQTNEPADRQIERQSDRQTTQWADGRANWQTEGLAGRRTGGPTD